MLKAWKIGVGAGATLLGVYIILTSLNDLLSVIVGIAVSAFGVALIASS